MSRGILPTYAELRDRPGGFAGTAWGLFGDGDELGTLNHLTPERVRTALASVRSGDVVNLNLSLLEFDPPLIAHRGVPVHEVFGLNEFHRDDRIDSLFTQASTQLDGLRHFGNPDYGFYNAVPGDRLRAGTPDLGIQRVAQRGIAGRGILLDVASYRSEQGRPIAQSRNEQIPVSDLDETIDWQGSDLRAGDILLIRTGWLEHVRRVGTDGGQVTSPGLAHTEATAAWLWDHQVSLVAADNIALEAWPVTDSELVVEAERDGRLAESSHSGMLHRILIPLLGMTIGELWDLDELANACRKRGTYDFFVTAEPLNLPGGVGSPANALAIL
jgi:kynurenine formamidase